jgi:hypothetical protein
MQKCRVVQKHSLPSAVSCKIQCEIISADVRRLGEDDALRQRKSHYCGNVVITFILGCILSGSKLYFIVLLYF